ncbi:MAG TPA: SagB/ThcOx family dehydrogenase [Gaiella sp.]|nr:SagB/ThcOx family dehydrogenase [Gaiella sp.]
MTGLGHEPDPATGDAEHQATVRLAQVLGADLLTGFDATEDHHEASRLYPGVVDPTVVGAARLERSFTMRVSATRSVKRHAHLPFVELPPGDVGTASLTAVLRSRRSARTYGEGALQLRELGTLLDAAYGVTGAIPGTPQALRSAPSGGALYPLELYVACQRVEGLDRALYHYDPLRQGLELLRPLGTSEESGDLTPYPELVAGSAAFVVMTAMFWRSRFKYGPRAYRFTLLEAGHVAQNLLLAAEALSLAATPVGGFFDRLVDEFVGVDGIYEASLYVLPVGRRA